MGTRKLAALVGLLCALFLMSAGVAGATTATVTAPANGAHVTNGFAGPVTVDFANDLTPGTFTVSVTGPGGYSWSQQPTVSNPGPQDFFPTAATTAGLYSVEVDEGGNPIAASSFTVDQPESARIVRPASGSTHVSPASVQLSSSGTRSATRATSTR